MSCKPPPSRRFNDREEGDMGIGTMMVFIAVILVSAVAAGTLINTAYLVQNQAEETGKLVLKNVATTFDIVDIRGDRFDDAGDPQSALQFLEMQISLGAGSPYLAMENVIIEVTTAYGQAILWFDPQRDFQHEWYDYDPVDEANLHDAAAAGSYTAQELRDVDSTFYEVPGEEDDEPDFVISQGCLIRIFIDLAANDITIGSQDWLSLKIIPKHGVPAYTSVIVPESFTDRYVPL